MVRIRTAELEESRAWLAHEAQHDHLTGLPNRILRQERLEWAVATAQRYGRTLAVLFIDLDGFKLVNDTLGHNAGDEVLRQVARRLSSSLRNSDTLARLAGDEFVALVSDLAEPDAARDVARALATAMAEPFEVFGRSVRLSASIGVSLFPDDALEAKTLQQHADTAMYRAKGSTGAGIAFYASEAD